MSASTSSNVSSEKLEEAESSNTNKQPQETNKKTLFDWVEIAVVPLAIAIVGSGLTWAQFQITNQRQDADSADKAVETREQVLSEYGKSIAELVVTKNQPRFSSKDFTLNNTQANIARGQTLIALRRLNPPGEDKNATASSEGKDKTAKSEQEQEKEKQTKLKAGKLKGLVIQYVYDNQLIGLGYGYGRFSSPESAKSDAAKATEKMSLAGADITNVVLENAWLPRIDLHNTELEGGNLQNSSLWGADLTAAKLKGANLKGADLRYTKLHSVVLDKNTDLTGACYVEGTEEQYFSSSFDPTAHGMVALSEEISDPGKPTFERCPTVR